MSRFVVALFVLAGCRSGETPTPSAAPAPTVAVTVVTTASATPEPAPPPLPAWDEAACTATGDFDLAAIWSKRACEVDGNGREHAFEPADALTFASSSTNLRAKSGGDTKVDVTFTNANGKSVDVVAYVSPDQPIQFQLHAAKNPDEAMTLLPNRASGFTRTDRPSWFAKIRFAPKARGRLTVAAKLTSSRIEHMESKGGGPAPYAKIDLPVPPGTYELRFSDMIGGHEIATKVNPKLVVE